MISYLIGFENFLPHCGPVANATSATSAKLISVRLVL